MTVVGGDSVPAQEIVFQSTFAPPLSNIGDTQVPCNRKAGPKDQVSEAIMPDSSFPPKMNDLPVDVWSQMANNMRPGGLR